MTTLDLLTGDPEVIEAVSQAMEETPVVTHEAEGRYRSG